MRNSRVNFSSLFAATLAVRGNAARAQQYHLQSFRFSEFTIKYSTTSVLALKLSTDGFVPARSSPEATGPTESRTVEHASVQKHAAQPHGIDTVLSSTYVRARQFPGFHRRDAQNFDVVTQASAL